MRTTAPTAVSNNATAVPFRQGMTTDSRRLYEAESLERTMNHGKRNHRALHCDLR